MRVAMLGAFPPQAQGIQDYCGGLVSALSERCAVTALGFKRMYPAFLFPGVKSAMDPTRAAPSGPYLDVQHRLTWYNPLGWLRDAACVPADVFHLQWWSLPLFPVSLAMLATMRLRDIPIVCTVHNVMPHERSPGFVAAGKTVCRFADAIIVHSERNREQLEQHYGIPGEKVVKVPMGVAIDGPPPMPPGEARRALGLPPEERVVLCFGAIRAYKGIDDLLRAFAVVTRDAPGLRLVIAGKPWMDWIPYQNVIDKHGLADQVSLFLDYVPEEQTPLFFAAADIVALPYAHFDAQSAVAARVLPYKKPLLVSDVGGLPEWVANDPAWIAPARDPEALAQRLLAFFADPEARTAAFARIADAVLAETAWPHVIDQYCRIYENVTQ